MKNVLKVFALVLVVFCMVVSCSKKASSSGSSGGSSNDTDGSGGTVTGSSSTAAVSSNNSLKNAVGNIKHGKDDIIFNNWAGIPWTDFGLSAAPAEPAGGKLEAAYISSGYPRIFISNVSRAAYEKLCREIEAGYNKEGRNTGNAFAWLISDLKLDDWDECYEITLSTDIMTGYRALDYEGEWMESGFSRIYRFRIYYFDSPVNGVIMLINYEDIL